MAVTGECFCGEVTYRVNGALHDARSCHCSRCRKAFNAQASAYAEVTPGTFEWLTGEDRLTTYGGRDGIGLQFCKTCGSTLCGVLDGLVHGVTLGCVNGDPDIEISRHVFVGSKAAWERIPDGVPQFEEWPPS
jgi:hypothetical protein